VENQSKGGCEIMRRLWWIILMVMLAAVVAVPGLASANDTFSIGSNTYYANGQAQTMDVAPYIESGRTMLPVRYVAEALGVSDSNIIYDPNSRKVTIINGSQVIQLTIGSNIMLINNAPITMDTAPEINDSHTFLPVAWVAQALGANISWNAGAQQVTIATGDSAQQVTASTGGIGGQSNSQPVPATVTPQVPEPTMALYPGTSPIGSGVFNGPQTVQVINNEGIIVYYTTDGSSPISSSTRIAYSGPFTVSQSETVNVATQDQYGNWSNVVSATFYINSSSQPAIVQQGTPSVTPQDVPIPGITTPINVSPQPIIALPSNPSSTPSAPAQPASIVLNPLTCNEQCLTPTYTWTYQGQQFTWTISVPFKLVQNEAFVQAPKASGASFWQIISNPVAADQGACNFNTIVNDSASSQYISVVASELSQTAQSQGYDSYQEADFIAGFVQEVPYILATDNTEYPPQAIADGGDCVNKSLLLASILHQIGYPVAVLIFPQISHAVCGIGLSPNDIPQGINNVTYYSKNDIDYYFTETTSPNNIGDSTLGLLGGNSSMTPTIYPIQ